jgi:hypothetical protein
VARVQPCDSEVGWGSSIKKLLREALVDLRIKTLEDLNAEQVIQEEHPTPYEKQSKDWQRGV